MGAEFSWRRPVVRFTAARGFPGIASILRRCPAAFSLIATRAILQWAQSVTAIAIEPFSPLTVDFFARPAERVAPELIGCLLVKREADTPLLWGVIVETEAYSQEEPACHGYRRRSPSNDTLFGEPGRFYVYVSYGMHHCVNVVTGRSDWANGVLLRAAALPGEPERVAAGPALLARRFGLDRRHDRQPSHPSSGLWLATRPPALRRILASPPVSQDGGSTTAGEQGRRALGASRRPTSGDASPTEAALMQTCRIGIREGQDLPWRWYLRCSRSVSRRARGDRSPPQDGLLPLLVTGMEG